MKSISDDDLCSSCTHCAYNPGELSACALAFPGTTDQDGYVFACAEFARRDTPISAREAFRLAHRAVRVDFYAGEDFPGMGFAAQRAVGAIRDKIQLRAKGECNLRSHATQLRANREYAAANPDSLMAAILDRSE